MDMSTPGAHDHDTMEHRTLDMDYSTGATSSTPSPTTPDQTALVRDPRSEFTRTSGAACALPAGG